MAGEGGAVGGEGNGVVISRSSSIYFCLKWRSRSYHDVKYLFNKTHIGIDMIEIMNEHNEES